MAWPLPSCPGVQSLKGAESCFCAETQIGTIVVMVSSFPPALFFSFQAAEDPTLWKDFPVLTRMTLVNFLGFIRTSRSVIWLFTRIFFPSSLDFNIKVLQSCTHIRSAMAEGFQVDLPCCNKSNCKLHTSNPWPLLQEVLAFSVKDLEPRLKELVLYLSRCSRGKISKSIFWRPISRSRVWETTWTLSTAAEGWYSTTKLYHLMQKRSMSWIACLPTSPWSPDQGALSASTCQRFAHLHLSCP